MKHPIVDSLQGVTLVGGGPVSAMALAKARALAPRIVGADSGADRLLRLGVTPEAVIGDMDSLSASARVRLADRLFPIAEQDTTDFDKALRIADNAKTQRYGTCNTMETLLVARAIAPTVLPELAKLYADKQVELRGDSEAQNILAGYAHLKAATEEDWRTEYLDAILSVKIVKRLGARSGAKTETGCGSKVRATIISSPASALARLRIC